MPDSPALTMPLALTELLTGRGFTYLPGWLDRADALHAWLREAVAWREETITLFGRSVTVPRRVAWFGDDGLRYRYANVDHPATGWPPELTPIRQRLQADGVPTNFVLANLYRNGRDHMGWHADDEAGMGQVIASLSLGASRRFLLRGPGEERSTRLILEHGSLLLLRRDVRHCLPRSRRVDDERINLTFRQLGA